MNIIPWHDLITILKISGITAIAKYFKYVSFNFEVFNEWKKDEKSMKI